MSILKLLIFTIFLSTIVDANDYILHGKVITYSEDGYPYPVEQIDIKIEGTGSNDVTYSIKKNSGGRFHLNLLNSKGKPLIKAGEKVRLDVNLSDKWFMLTPFNGEFFLPKNSKNHDIEVILLANNSQLKRKKSRIKFFNTEKEKVEYCVQILSVNSPSSARKTRDEFNNKWKKKYNAYIETVTLNRTKIYKVLVTVNPYSKSNIVKLRQDIIQVAKYKKLQPFIRLTVR